MYKKHKFKKKILFICLPLYIISSVKLFASDLYCKRADLLSLYNISKNNNPTYLQQKAKTNSSLENIGIAKSYLYPNISGSASYQFNHTDGSNSSHSHNMSYGLSINQNVFNLNALESYKAAQILGHSADPIDQASYQKMVFDLIKTYLLVAQDQAIIDLNKKELEQSKKIMAFTKNRYESGQSASYDVAQARASYLSGRQALLSAEQKYKTDKYNLEQITGKALHINSFKLLKQDYPKYKINKKSFGEMLYSAYHNNPILIADNINLDSQRSTIKANKYSNWPTALLSASYGRNYQYSYLDHDSSLPTINDYTNHYNTAAISLNIDIPIFSGGLISHQVKQAAYNYADDQQQLYIDQQNVRDNLKSSIEQLEIGNELRDLDLDNVQAQKQAYDDTFTAYQAGKRDVQIFQVIQAQSYVLSASQSKINNLYNYVLSQIQLKYSLGDLSEKDVISLNSYLV